jgi:hypothetical protein
MTIEQFQKLCDAKCVELCGMSSDDLPDTNSYHDYYPGDNASAEDYDDAANEYAQDRVAEA